MGIPLVSGTSSGTSATMDSLPASSLSVSRSGTFSLSRSLPTALASCGLVPRSIILSISFFTTTACSGVGWQAAAESSIKRVRNMVISFFIALLPSSCLRYHLIRRGKSCSQVVIILLSFGRKDDFYCCELAGYAFGGKRRAVG